VRPDPANGLWLTCGGLGLTFATIADDFLDKLALPKSVGVVVVRKPTRQFHLQRFVFSGKSRIDPQPLNETTLASWNVSVQRAPVDMMRPRVS
jgi:hypothetical protein